MLDKFFPKKISSNSSRIGFCLLLCVAALLPQQAMSEVLFYSGYGDAHTILVEGRVREDRTLQEAKADDGRWINLKRSTRQFMNDEYKNVPVQLFFNQQNWTAKTDDEGYFRFEFSPGAEIAPGWHKIRGTSEDVQGSGQFLLVPEENVLGLISDLDDTLLISEVTSKRRLLKNTFLKNPAQRQPVPGVAALYTRIRTKNPFPEYTPLFYLSASPRQLHTSIANFLNTNHFPPGVLITKRIGLDRASDPLLDQFNYKKAKIEEILTRLPKVRFILVGDDGEKDPEIYDWVRQKYPERIEAIWIRQVHSDPKRLRFENQLDLQDVISNPQ